MPAASKPLEIGLLIYPQVDQLDFSGPFEVFSRLPGARMHVLWKERTPVRDVRGLILTPEETLAEAPDLDVLVIPGGAGQEGLMEDADVLGFIRRRAEQAHYLFSVCTGALVLGAAGLLEGRRATTHWTAQHLLPYFGAIPVDERVVIDGSLITAAGVTSGIDGALKVAALLCGEPAAQVIQLSIQYAPEPPFSSGNPRSAPEEILRAARVASDLLTARRLETAKRFANQAK